MRLTLLAGMMGLATCTQRVPLTWPLKYQYALGERELKGLQYYVSHDVVLRREVREDKREVTPQAQLLLIDDREREVLRIRAGTPCVAVRAGPDWLEVQFEPGQATLRFQASRQTPESNPRRVASKVVAVEDGQVVLHSPSDRWEEGYKLVGVAWRYDPVSRGFQGVVRYEGKDFTTDDSASRATLLIDRKRFAQTTVQDQMLPGLVLPETER
ncbi:hypothetical protein OV207_20740 [Corallococcus sp. BB11-1]|uniref:hypothetical protein n=1 Tax=Corallococcus sp. BB11-1 TaxID=2996783 RepID=UPI00226EDB1B|nr:hypothetical protein [Corallococcus sp. BB11-1]MCY1033893.1 hypothetical protein [Corallococcus sp. BB11-1]